mgnify:FL=1
MCSSDLHYTRFAQELFRKTMFFGFVIRKRGEISAKTRITSDFQVTPELLEEFREFVFSDSAFSHFQSTALLALEDSRDAWKKERRDRDSTADTASMEFDKAATALKTLLRAEVSKEFDANREFIKRQLKAELLGATLGDDARTDFEVRHDPQVDAAIRYLKDSRLFVRTLKPGKEKG